jgi:hypothetical protein
MSKGAAMARTGFTPTRGAARARAERARAGRRATLQTEDTFSVRAPAACIVAGCQESSAGAPCNWNDGKARRLRELAGS